MKSFGLPAWGRGLRACWRGVCVSLKKKKKLVLTAGVCVCVVVGFRGEGGHQASASQGPADTNTGIQEQLDPSSPLPPSPPPSTLVLRNAGRRVFFFSGNETLLCSEDSRRFSRPPHPPTGRRREEVGGEVGQALGQLLKCGRLR